MRVRYLARKVGFYLIALWGALTLNFFLPRLIPGNPVEALLARMSQTGNPPPGEYQALQALLGLGGSNIFAQYAHYLDQLAHLNLGVSITNFPVPVTSIISSALDLAVRYDWADRNVAKNASPPHPRKREPDPPSPDQAARLLNLVWAEDEEFGLYLWTAFTTGARRGEVSALRENRFDFTRQQVRLARNYLVKQGQHIEKAPKDSEGRVLSLDLLTCELFQERFRRRRAEARAQGVEVPEDAFAFSPDPAGREP